MLDWLKAIAIGVLQPYLYEQLEDWIISMQQKNPSYFDAAGNVTVPLQQVPQFFRDALKALLFILRHGTP